MDNMVTVCRANVVLDIKESQLPKYLSIGYNQIDSVGNVIRESTHKDILSLTRLCDRQKAEIQKLTAKIDELQSNLNEAHNTKSKVRKG